MFLLLKSVSIISGGADGNNTGNMIRFFKNKYQWNIVLIARQDVNLNCQWQF